MRCRCGLVLLVLLALPLLSRAEHARIDLRVQRLGPNDQVKDEASAHADREPPSGGLEPRPLFKVRSAEPLVLQFFLTNTYPHGEKKDVTVRWYVVREEKLGQKKVPDRSSGTVTEGEVTMNFKPQCRVGARVAFTIKDAGVYLLRVETSNTDSDHEHFSAIELQVK